MIYVVGSGPAGMFCAAALLQRGCQVTLLDVGSDLEPHRQQQLAQLRSIPSDNWMPQDTAFLRENLAPDRKGIGLKYAHGSDYPYRDVDRYTPIERTGVNTTASLALGGFTTIWGAAMLPYAAHDLTDWPIGPAELAPHYSAVLSMMGYSAVSDDLAEFWPLYHSSPLALQHSNQARSLLQRIRPSIDTLKQSGIYIGSSRLAVRADRCIYCGLCMYGCPHELIFNAAHLLPRLRQDPKFTYRPSVLVQRVEESAGGVIIRAMDTSDGQSLRFSGERLYLGAGVLNTARIMLQSLEAFNQPLPMADSCYFLLPWMRWRGQRGVTTEALYTLAQLFIEIIDPQISAHTVHLQLYTYNDLYVGAIQKLLGPLYKAARPALEMALARLHILQGYLHSSESPSIELRLLREGERGKLLLSAVPAATDYRKRIARVIGKLYRQRRQLGGFPLKLMLHVPEPGRGFHSGGTFPMRRAPGRFETDLAGRPSGFTRVHLVDSSTFPTIPATTITLSVSANAHRIGSLDL